MSREDKQDRQQEKDNLSRFNLWKFAKRQEKGLDQSLHDRKTRAVRMGPRIHKHFNLLAHCLRMKKFIRLNTPSS